MINNTMYQPSEKEMIAKLKGQNWIAAFMLLWMFGMWGGHRFYTGKTGSAIAMLIMSLTGILSIISVIWMLVDAFTLTFGDFETASGESLYEKRPILGYIYFGLILLSIVLFFTLVLSMILPAVAH